MKKNIRLNNSATKPKRTFYVLLGLIVLIAIVFHLFLFSRGFYSISADESGRTMVAYQWAKNGKITAGNWLPFYTIFVGLFLKVWCNLFLLPRLISFFYGLFTLISLSWLTHELFGNKNITLIVALLAAVFPQRVILGLVPLSEIMFIFMIITGCAFFVRWLNSNNSKLLIGSSIFFALASSIRYEGWVFLVSFLLFIFLFQQQHQDEIPSRTLILLFCISLAFPIYWLFLHAIQTGNPLSFTERPLNENLLSELKNNLFTPYIIKNVLKVNVFTQFIIQNFRTLNLFGLIPLFFLIISDNRRVKNLSLVVGGALMLMSLIWFFVLLIPGTVFRLPPSNVWRFASVWSVLLLPFTAYFIYQQKQISESLKVKRGMMLPGFVLLFFIAQFIGQTLNMREQSAFSKNERFLGEFLTVQLHNKKDAKILIETPEWSYLNIVIASGLPDNFIYNSGANPRRAHESILNKEQISNDSKLQELGIQYFVFRADLYKRLLANNERINKLKDFGAWSVFKLNTDFRKHKN